jgi:hydrogenase maturation protease
LTAQPRILVACIGNIFLGDDAFGCEVARRLNARSLPVAVRVVDFGIRSYDLAFALMDGYDVTILVDATPRGNEPGTLYTIEPDLTELDHVQASPGDAHGLNPIKVLSMVKAMGGEFKRILLVGCEPATLESVDGQMTLSAPVAAAADEAVNMIESLITELLKEQQQLSMANTSN